MHRSSPANSPKPAAISTMRVQSSTAGMPVQIVYGRNRVVGNLIWYGNFLATPHTAPQQGGGKGGGGGGGNNNTTYTYTASLVLALAEGPISSVDAVWATKTKSTVADLGFSLFNGTNPQTPWSYLTSNFPGQDLAYAGTAYVAEANYPLDNSGALPNHSFEVTGIAPYAFVPTAAPSLTYVAGGSIAATTYYVKITYVNASGLEIAQASPEATPAVTTSASENITVPGSGTYVPVHSATFVANVSAIGPGPTTLTQMFDGFSGNANEYIVSGGAYTFSADLIASAVQVNYTYISTQIPANNLLRVLSPAGASGVTAYHVYASTTPGAETKQTSSPIAIGTNWTEPTSGLISGAAVPTSATAVYDANPYDVMVDFLTNTQYGANFNSAWIDAPSFAQYSLYCRAAQLFMSPVLSDQKPAAQWAQELLDSTMCVGFWSEGVLKLVPWADTAISSVDPLTAATTTWTPVTTPLYDLTDDDFIYATGEDPVRVDRKDQSQSFNHVQVEFSDRASDYNVAVADAVDLLDVSVHGKRKSSPRQHHQITTAAVAQYIAQLALQRSLYIRNTYSFRLPFRFCALEPMDIVTINDPAIGLTQFAVRIIEVQETPDGELSIVAEEFPAGTHTPALYTVPSNLGYTVNYNASAGNINAPIIFEPTAPLITLSQPEIWFGVSGPATMGKVDVWVSFDNATYQRQGSITSPARLGVTTAALASGTDPDTLHTLSVDLTSSRGTLTSGTQADADLFSTLCYVDGEFLSYKTATLTAANKYNLTYLRRGAYESTNASHISGVQFVRVDNSIGKIAYDPSRIGSSIWLKFVTSNVWGGGTQNLSDVSAYQYKITGVSLTTPPGDITNLVSNYLSNITRLYWTPVTDSFRTIDYEIRKGGTWATGQVVYRTTSAQAPTFGDATYWIAARATIGGVSTYSANPQNIVVSSSIISKNIIATYEESPAWTGSVSGGAVIIANNLQLAGNDIFLDADVFADTDVFTSGAVITPGTYTSGAGSIVNIGRPAACQVIIKYTSAAESVFDNVLTATNFLALSDMLGALLGSSIFIRPQVALAQADGIYGAWTDYYPGTYSAQYFKSRVTLSTNDPSIIPLVTQYSFSVDVPDRADSYVNTSIGSGGSTITYNTPFNGGPGGAASPNVQVTILNATAGDDIVISASSVSAVTLQIKNGGVGVARSVNLVATGY